MQFAALFQVTMLTLAGAGVMGHDGDDVTGASARLGSSNSRTRCRKPRKEMLTAQLINATVSYKYRYDARFDYYFPPQEGCEVL